MSSVASVRTGEAKSVVSVCQLLTDIRRRRPLNQTLYGLVVVLIVVNLLIFVLLTFSLLPQSSYIKGFFFKKIHHKQVHYQLLQSLVEGPPAANVREKLAHLDHALSLPCTDGGN